MCQLLQPPKVKAVPLLRYSFHGNWKCFNFGGIICSNVFVLLPNCKIKIPGFSKFKKIYILLIFFQVSVKEIVDENRYHVSQLFFFFTENFSFKIFIFILKIKEIPDCVYIVTCPQTCPCWKRPSRTDFSKSWNAM